MNIFATNPNPYIAAQALDDRRLVKMVLETAQLINTALHLHGFESVYAPTHASHPCTKWAHESWSNLWWLWMHGEGLAMEYTVRFGREHKSWETAIKPHREMLKWKGGDQTGMTPFANCARNEKLGLDFTHLPVHEAYREYLCAKWRIGGARWTNANPPLWYSTVRVA